MNARRQLAPYIDIAAGKLHDFGQRGDGELFAFTYDIDAALTAIMGDPERTWAIYFGHGEHVAELVKLFVDQPLVYPYPARLLYHWFDSTAEEIFDLILDRMR